MQCTHQTPFHTFVCAGLGMRRTEADLLEGVDSGRVSSEGQGKLQQIQLHRAEERLGSLQDQLIVG